MIHTTLLLWQKYHFIFVDGLWGTLWLSAISVLSATVLATILTFMKLSKSRAFDLLVNLFMLIIRGTPILLQLYFFWLWLPQISPLTLSDTQCIVVALVVNASAYVAEVIRSGIQSVEIGQTEAAHSLGISRIHTLIYIVAPQALKTILPALGNQYIMMIKQTSLASVFFVQELMTSYKTVQSATFLSIPSLMVVGLIYLLLTTVLTNGLDLFERRLQKSERC